MVSKKVAGTIILHLQNGSKRFLVHSIGNGIELASTVLCDDCTSLANLLQMFKNSIRIDVNNINLLELTNWHKEDENIPVFVFEAEESALKEELPEGYTWGEPHQFRQLIQNYNLEGAPLF